MTQSVKNFVLEIGTEEIPSSYIPPAVEELKTNFIERAGALRLRYSDLKVYATPRRLVLFVSELNERQEKTVIETLGPPERVAYTEDGQPTKAAIGFAASQGVEVGDLKIKETERGRYVVVQKEIPGEKTERILAELIPDLIQSLHFPKTMRWGSNNFRFVRPIQWILTLYGDRVIKCEVGGIRADRKTYGHRFMAPNAIRLKNANDYLSRLRALNCIVDIEERCEFLKKQLSAIEKRFNIKVVYTESLFSTVINLVEYPFAVLCNIPERFMNLPESVLRNVLNEQQRFFTTLDRNNKITSKFVAVSNLKPKNQNVLKSGYERVVSARLADADFFFKEDLKTPLSARVEKLKNLIYFEKLGTYYDKTLRLEKLAVEVMKILDPEKCETVKRAARLSKADLLSHMVIEFPKLQGIMGMEYARHEKESDEVALAIYEHYLPTYAGDKLAKSISGIVLGLVDKIDNILSGFVLGYAPTGTTDPHALRRQALGIINTLLNSGIKVSIAWLSDLAIDEIGKIINFDKQALRAQILEFFRGRLLGVFTGEGFPREIVDAVIGDESLDPVSMREKILVLSEAMKDERINSLLLAYKRVTNILGRHNFENIDENRFVEVAEKELYSAVKNIEADYWDKLRDSRYMDGLANLYSLINPINNFFDNVLVMSEDNKLKENRLALLNKLKKMFLKFADFSKLPVKNTEV